MNIPESANIVNNTEIRVIAMRRSGHGAVTKQEVRNKVFRACVGKA